MRPNYPDKPPFQVLHLFKLTWERLLASNQLLCVAVLYVENPLQQTTPKIGVGVVVYPVLKSGTDGLLVVKFPKFSQGGGFFYLDHVRVCPSPDFCIHTLEIAGTPLADEFTGPWWRGPMQYVPHNLPILCSEGML